MLARQQLSYGIMIATKACPAGTGKLTLLDLDVKVNPTQPQFWEAFRESTVDCLRLDVTSVSYC